MQKINIKYATVKKYENTTFFTYTLKSCSNVYAKCILNVEHDYQIKAQNTEILYTFPTTLGDDRSVAEHVRGG